MDGEYQINDIRTIAEFKGESFSKYKKTDVRKELLNSILNGKIDLVFLHEGKYYILDWKSNFLGNHTGAYERPLLCKAMQENHFYLQYYVYGMAFRRYLTSRIPSFDFDTQFGGVFYLFFRGMRTGAQTGVYFHRPSSVVIEELSRVIFT